ncbi:hypothetical protein GQ44DRAFT_728298 [Phaeosphaeriaceae sp. PMI808]|nr:hypothetical protein GQ44DRAFT_728298 [Phaeosphaeriaceae sp. PMI808]
MEGGRPAPATILSVSSRALASSNWLGALSRNFAALALASYNLQDNHNTPKNSRNSKVGTYLFQILAADKVKEKAELARAFVAAVEKDIEPLLKNVNPFFGGSEHLTLAEVLISPFLLRIYALIRNGYPPTLLKDGLDALLCFSTLLG